MLDTTARGIKIAPFQHKCRAKQGTLSSFLEKKILHSTAPSGILHFYLYFGILDKYSGFPQIAVF